MNIIGWVLMVLGGLFLGVGVWLLSSAYASTSWPTVEGQIIETKVVGRISQAGRTLQRHIEYSIEVTYEYEVNQVSYKANRYSLGTGDTVAGGFNEKSEARAWLKESAFYNNPPVTVYVNPNDPTDTVLSAGIKWSTFVPVIMALLFMFLGYFVRLIVPKT